MKNRRTFLMGLTCMAVSLGLVVGTALADELIGRITKVNVEDKTIVVTEKGSHKVEEIEAKPEVALTFSKHGEYVSASGRASISTSRALVESLWDEEAEAWMPKGKDDPSVVVLVVDPDEAEIWDVTSNKVKQAFEFAKAYLGDKDGPDTTKHEKISL